MARESSTRRARTQFVCQSCGASQPKWMGRCPDCGEWNSLVETLVETTSTSAAHVALSANAPLPLASITSDGQERLPVPLEELSRVLGGGVVLGSVVLLGGDPGIGKSTLLMQLAARMAAGDRPVLYASGEESARQLKLRAERLGIQAPNLYILSETSIENIIDQMLALRPLLAVVDSIQSVHVEALASSAGSIGQVRESANALLRVAKAEGIPVFLVGHVTKTGSIAGPRVLEHVVDTVLYMEGERFHSFRLLRGVKNRFGSTDEVGVFEMRERGLVEVTNPSRVFLEERLERATGSTVAATLEGTRPLLVEVQALVSKGSPEFPRRTCNGIEQSRLHLLVAVLSKRVGLQLGDQDIFVNVVGGLHVREPAVDLAVAIAIASSYHNRPVKEDMVVFGEVGLAGELRSVGQSERRLREAAKLGFKRGLLARVRGAEPLAVNGIEPLGARSLAEAVSLALDPGTGERRRTTSG
ncbi:MAG: DNA repair protein RadA [Chloroflexi bacterium]|nr:DNA repair protein RadA [Chloroflexota bacterium]